MLILRLCQVVLLWGLVAALSFFAWMTTVAAAAYDLESMLVATHPEVIGELVGTDGADALAAAVIVEARQASALAAVAGKLDDLDVMLVNSAEPVSLAAATDLLAAATATTEG